MDPLEDLSRRHGRVQNQIDPTRARPQPWFVGGGSRLMIVVVSIVAVLVVIRAVSTIWMVEEAWHWLAAGPAPSSRVSPIRALPHPAPPPADSARANATLRGNPATAFGPDMYPVESIRREEQGRTVARLSIDASGTPVGCIIAISSGYSRLDERTCEIAIKRVRFDPARDGRGVAIASTYTLPVRWVLPER